MMNKNSYYLFNQDPNDDTIVRSIREFGLSYLNIKANHTDIINEHNKLREEFLSNGSEPIDIIGEELKTVNWIEIENEFNNNINYNNNNINDNNTSDNNNNINDYNNNNEQLESYNKYMNYDVQQQQQQQQKTNQINTTMYFKKISPFDLKKRERRSRSISQTMDNHCVFCSNNNQPLEVVRSHSVRDIFGRVLCPKLRTYVCPICNSSGDSAHTVKYCPKKPVITMEDAIMLENIKYNEMLKKFEKFR